MATHLQVPGSYRQDRWFSGAPRRPGRGWAIRRRVHALRRWTWRQRLGAGAVLPLLMLSATLVRWAPFRHYARVLGRPLGAVACVPLCNGRSEARARRIGRCVRRAALLSPWRADCLPQALAAALLCRALQVPASIHLGVRRDAQHALVAHAWLCSGAVTITGGNGFDDFAVVACYLIGVPSRTEMAPD